MTAQTAHRLKAARKLTTQATRNPDLVEAAQRLRFQVFSAEYGADLGAATPGIDSDHYDAFCDHLVVMDETSNTLIATTRVLHQTMAEKAGGFYSATEFDLERLLMNEGTIAEVGRTCVHPDYRSGAVISLLWAAIADYLVTRNVDYLIGCASIGMADGGLKAWRIARKLQREHLADPAYQVTPRRALPHLTQSVHEDKPVAVPPLIKAYMRLGAKVCGEPCWDPDFRCADLLVVLAVSELAERYSRHYKVSR